MDLEFALKQIEHMCLVLQSHAVNAVVILSGGAHFLPPCLGTQAGKEFLQSHQHITEQFTVFCTKLLSKVSDENGAEERRSDLQTFEVQNIEVLGVPNVIYGKVDSDSEATINNDLSYFDSTMEEFTKSSREENDYTDVYFKQTERNSKEESTRNKFILNSSVKYHLNGHSDTKLAFGSRDGGEIIASVPEMVNIFKSEGITKYSCKLCGENLKEGKRYDIHIYTHLVKKCTVCPKTFSDSCSVSKVTRHVKNHQKCPYMCQWCYKNFSTADERDKHAHLHSKKLKCAICLKEYDSISRYNNHMKFSHGPKTYKCQVCDSSFSSQAVLKKHEHVHGEKEHLCDQCDARFATIYSLKNHIEHVHLESEKLWKCDACEKTYKSRKLLSDHMRYHRSPVLCDTCGKAFSTPSSLRLHNLSMHSAERKYKCDTCGDSFPILSSLKRHSQKHVGSGSGNYIHQCSYCEKSFKTKGALESHENVHTKLKQYRCSFCSSEFLRISTLYSHKRAVHHDQLTVGQILPRCRYCREKFKNSYHLFKHVKAMHYEEDLMNPKPYMKQCPICSKVFLPKNLKVHMDMHNEVKPHKCVICRKAFTDKCNLRGHLKMVHKEGSFRCNTCAKMFFDGYSIHEHFHKEHVLTGSDLEQAVSVIERQMTTDGEACLQYNRDEGLCVIPHLPLYSQI